MVDGGVSKLGADIMGSHCEQHGLPGLAVCVSSCRALAWCSCFPASEAWLVKLGAGLVCSFAADSTTSFWQRLGLPSWDLPKPC